jgi:hypothetical protein
MKTDKNYNLPFGKIRYLDAIYCDEKQKDYHTGLQLDILISLFSKYFTTSYFSPISSINARHSLDFVQREL